MTLSSERNDQLEPCSTLPNNRCRYHHTEAETPIGTLRIEWKDWKERTDYECLLPWEELVYADGLDEAKSAVQKAWNSMVKEMSSLCTKKDTV
jgi:hypothetical protein